MKEIRSELENLLSSLNIPAEYLDKEQENIDYCQNCSGLQSCPTGGYKILLDGKSAKRCYLRVIAESKIPPLYLKKGLDNFEIGHNKNVIDRVNQYLDNKEFEQGVGLVLVGNCGVGKTHLAVGIMKEVARISGKNVLFFFVPDFLDDIRRSYEKLEEEDLVKPARETFFIVLDDLGTEKITEWSREKILQIINYRVNHMLPFIITTNYSGEVFKERVGERAYSRIMGCCEVLLLHGKDRRISR